MFLPPIGKHYSLDYRLLTIDPMAKRTKKNQQPSRRIREKDVPHWLGEGSLGQESLMGELDAFLFAIDSAIAHQASIVARRVPKSEDVPTAVLVPPEGSIGWHLGFLSQFYEVRLWAHESDEVQGLAADHFNARIQSGELRSWLEYAVDLFLFTDTNWQAEFDFTNEVREATSALSDYGSACFVLSGVRVENRLQVCWTSGATRVLDDILEGRIFGLKPPDQHIIVFLKDELNKSTRSNVVQFLKRHQEFFGKDSKGLCLSRMREADFTKSSKEVPVDDCFVTLLVWDNSSNYK